MRALTAAAPCRVAELYPQGIAVVNVDDLRQNDPAVVVEVGPADGQVSSVSHGSYGCGSGGTVRRLARVDNFR